MVLRRTQVGFAVALAVSLAACGSDPALVSTGVDVERARSAWQDPWAAPDLATLPTNVYGTDDGVRRRAGSRATVHTGGPVDASLLEVRAAISADWRLVGARCGDEQVIATLVKGDDLDDGMYAELFTAVDDDRTSEVMVTVLVPHHADRSWISPTTLDPAQTCLAGNDSTPEGSDMDDFEVLDEAGPPLSRGDDSGVDDVPKWKRTKPAEGDRALAAALSEDPWFASTGESVHQPDISEGDNRRFAPTARGAFTIRGAAKRQALRDAVAEMKGWTVTWASCGPDLPAAASLVKEFEEGTVVARVNVDGDSAGGVATWMVTLPVVEAPDLAPRDVSPLRGSTCLSASALPPGITLEGTPVALPYTLQPVAR